MKHIHCTRRGAALCALLACLLCLCACGARVEGKYKNANSSATYEFTVGDATGCDYGGTALYDWNHERDCTWKVKGAILYIDGKEHILDGSRFIEKDSRCTKMKLTDNGTHVAGSVNLDAFYKQNYYENMVFSEDGTFERTTANLNLKTILGSTPDYYVTKGQYYIQGDVLVAGESYRFAIHDGKIYGNWFEKQ